METSKTPKVSAPKVPFLARRVLARFEPQIREEIISLLKDRHSGEAGKINISWKELWTCISESLSSLSAPEESDTMIDKEVFEASLKDFTDGKSLPTKGYLDAIRSSLADCGSDQIGSR